MAEGGNNTIGRANVELGADTSKLSAGLKDAKKQTEETVAAVEKKAAQASPQVESISIATKTLGERMSNATKPIRAVVAAFTQMLAIVSAVTGAIGLVVYGFNKITEEARKKAEAIAAATEAFKKYKEELSKTQSESLTGRTDEVQQITKRYNAQIDKEKELYYQLERAAWKKKTNYTETLSQIVNERDERVKALEDEKQKEIAAVVRYTAAQQKLADEAAKAAAETKLKAEQDALDKIKEERKRDMDELTDYWMSINQEITKQNTENMRAQQQQFSQLRNEINGLFNTNQLEIGINRLGALMEIMVQKIGDSR